MPRPNRKEQFAPDEVSICHCVQRCVRRAYLAGVDRESGIDYSHRKEWIRRRMEALASVFGVDVLSYAIMSNHLHVILRNRPDVVAVWSDEEVAIRWLRVFPGKRIEGHLAEPTDHEVKTLASDAKRIAEIRLRLSDFSWFMRSLAEPIARMANKQDECTGRFWEGRFKAQRIVDEAGLLACAMYVDLNPVRAALAESPDQSPHTSAYDRIEGAKGKEIASAAFDLKPVEREQAAQEIRTTPVDQLRRRRNQHRHQTGRRVARDGWLSPLALGATKLASDAEPHRDGFRASDKGFLGLAWDDYLRLLRWTARQGLDSMTAKVPKGLAERLTAMGIEAGMWADLVWNWQKYFGKSSCVGRPESMKADAAAQGKPYHRGQGMAASCFA
jgi:REP element-mobilizing transposase RayT